MFPVFRTDPKHIVEQGGRFRFAPGKRCSRLPPLDSANAVFATVDQATAEDYARKVGARLPTDAEVNQIAKVAYWIAPTIVRETTEEAKDRAARGGANPLERMATLEWARREHSGVMAQLAGWDGDRPVLNAGKHWEARSEADRTKGVAVNVGWDTDPRVDVTKWIQSPGRAHNAGPSGNGHVDYSQTLLLVWDEDKPSDPPRKEMIGAAAPAGNPTMQLDEAASDQERYMPDALTPATKDEIYRSLKSAAPELGRNSLLVLLAQYCLETGAGKSMHRWNLGNFKHVKGDGRLWTMFACSEIIAGKTQWFYPPHPQTWFRAYETLEAGAADYVASLRRRFSKAWAEVEKGDIRAFGHALKIAGYYTADERAYTDALDQWFRTLDSTIGFDVAAALDSLDYPDVRSFQAANPPLVVDGIAGRNTIAALKLALSRASK